MDMPRYSPWGAIQHCHILCEGVYEVDTASHGGIMVTRSAVDDVLSKPAQECGFWEHGYLCFEEDADAQIVIRELLDQRLIEPPERYTPEEYNAVINQCIEHWHPDYWEYHTKTMTDGKGNTQLDMTIRDMTPQEHKYSYSQSQQLVGQTGCIGHLRGYFDGDGKDFQHTWDAHLPSQITDDFKLEFDQVVKALRSDKQFGGMLKSRDSLAKYCNAHPDARFDPERRDFGARADTQNYTYMLRLNPSKGEYGVYCYCYRRDWLTQHMANAERGIRFITPNYEEKFRIPDGDQIRITDYRGETFDRTCRYIDDYHLEVGGSSANLYHIAEFAERMEHNGSTVIPLRSSLPEYCYSVLPSSGELILISRGTDGYMSSKEGRPGETGREAADRLNGLDGITRAQESAMLAGCTSGWDKPAANPKNYDEQGQLKQGRVRQRGDAR